MLINLFLDLIIANITSIPTYFVLINSFKIPLRYICLLIVIALFIDLYLTHTFLLNLIIFLSSYFLFRHLNKKNNLFNNILFNTLIYLIYIISLYLYFNYNNINLLYLSKYLFLNYPLYLIYVLISYKFFLKS